ncbi:M16 family metallopeptidase [Ramlibacter albus]|uniref:Insulinase family protein n=1 Tax=Ramlibacter albus TaxID=2079448 RepID=A0A923MCW3_9BURK|nr:pitrilysin family protein [Ramlibacter albus]MBC5766994.1 insulinase family protein [Ramlibacter albus]
MIRLVLAALLAVLSLAAHALPANVEHVETFGGISQYRLKSNGMPILLHADRSAPVATFMVVYHMGSRNEAPGYTGAAHLLEHMIFNKSTENFGRAKGHKTFQEVLYELGADAGSSNMTTWYDRMNGYSTVPSDKLHSAMKIEADRLGRGLILDNERQSEMTVVRNEYEIGENNPQRVLLQSVVATAITSHPYHWPTIGYRSDIEGVSTAKLREIYKTFFHPDNATAILSGDFDTESALALFDKEFGGFPKSTQPIPRVLTVEPPQEGERRTIVRRPGTFGLVMAGYTRPGVMHPDFNALMVLDNILSEGVNSRLYKALRDTGIASGVAVLNFALRDPYPFLVQATLPPGKTHEEAERVIKAVLADVAEKGVTDAEVARARSQIEVDLLRTRDGAYSFARNLGEYVASSHWKRYVTLPQEIARVTPADVQRVARAYLVPERGTIGWFVPLPPGTPRAAAVPASPPPQASAAQATPAPAAARAEAAQRPSFAQRTVRRVLPNGVVVDVIRNTASPTVAVRGAVLGGDAASPAGQPMMASLLSRMLARGTTARTKEEIGRLLDSVGATRSYGLGLGDTGFTLAGAARDLPLLLEIAGEELRSPAFAEGELALAKQELETDVLRADDSTADRAMQRLVQLAYPQGHPYWQPGRAEKVANTRALTAAQLREFHAQRFTGANVVLAIVGDVDPQAAIAAAEKAFGALPAGKRLEWPQLARVAPGAPARELVAMPGKANMNLMLGGASGLRRLDPDFEAALVANAVLGQSALASRIGKRVRDTEGLSYSLASRFGFSEELDGLWFVNVNLAPQNLAAALKSTREEIDRYVREGATEDEVRAQKDFFAGNFQVNLGSNAGIAGALVFAERYGFGPSYLDEYPRRMQAVTREQANAAMKRYFPAGKLHLVVAGDVPQLPD